MRWPHTTHGGARNVRTSPLSSSIRSAVVHSLPIAACAVATGTDGRLQLAGVALSPTGQGGRPPVRSTAYSGAASSWRPRCPTGGIHPSWDRDWDQRGGSRPKVVTKEDGVRL